MSASGKFIVGWLRYDRGPQTNTDNSGIALTLTRSTPPKRAGVRRVPGSPPGHDLA